MATKAKASFSSCLSFLKDTLLLPTRNAKLFVPFLLLIAAPSFLLQILSINQINNKDASSADIEKVLKEMLKEDMVLFMITISIIITIFIMITVVYGYAVQIIALFAASTTYSGDRHSLPELFSKFILKGRHLKGPLITIVMVSVLNITGKVLIAALLELLMPRRRLGAPYITEAFSLFRSLMFIYLDVVFVVAVAVSVADTERRGVGALRQAWRLMTRVWRMGGCLLVVVVTFLEMVPPPLHRVALGYARESMPLGLALFSVHALLSGLVQIFYYSAATVYYHQAMEIKEVMPHDYVAVVPSGEETTGTV